MWQGVSRAVADPLDAAQQRVDEAMQREADRVLRATPPAREK